jgi:hypothetical protein
MHSVVDVILEYSYIASRFDNCYDAFYENPAAVSQFHNDVYPRLQRAYWSTPKPDTGFWNATSSLNVVIHARRGDAKHRAMRGPFMNNAMRALREEHPDTVFWVYTDDTPEKMYSELVNSTNVRVFANGESDLLCAFHQMINADVLIISDSGFSHTAALIGHSGSPRDSMVLGCVNTRMNLKVRPNRDLLGWDCTTPCDSVAVKLENRSLARRTLPPSWKWNGHICGLNPYVPQR